MATVDGFDRDASDGKAWGGLAFDPDLDPHVLESDSSNVSETLAGVTCTTSTPNGARTSSAVRWNSRSPVLAVRTSSTADKFAGGNAAQRPGRASNPDVDDGRWLADQLELRRKIGELERDAQRALDRLLA